MITPTYDTDNIASLLGMISGHDFVPTEGWRYFEVTRNGTPAGIICFEPWPDGVWEGHILILPNADGMASRYAKQAARAMIRAGASRVIGLTPEYHYRALRAAFGAGFKYIAKVGDYHLTEFVNG